MDTAPTSTSYHMTTRARGNNTATAQNISIRPFTRVRVNQPSATLQATDALVTTGTQPPASQDPTRALVTTATQPSTSQEATSALVTTATQPPVSQEAAIVIDLDSADTVSQTPSNSNNDYAVYLSIMGMTSDLSDDEEELSQAIMASLESHA